MKYFLIFFFLLALLAGCVSIESPETKLTPTAETSPTIATTTTQPAIHVTAATPFITIDTYARTPRPQDPRPQTGTIISGSSMFGGKGTFSIDNSKGNSDVVSIITRHNDKTPIESVFIQKWTSYEISGINDGTYDVYVLSGDNWDPSARKFTNNSAYIKFEDSFPFTTSSTYSHWTVTLYQVVAGNAKTQSLSQDDFPVL